MCTLSFYLSHPLCCSQTSEDRFSRVEAHFKNVLFTVIPLPDPFLKMFYENSEHNISIINTTSKRLKAIHFFIWLYFSFYEQLKFCAQLSWAWKKFYNLGAWQELRQLSPLNNGKCMFKNWLHKIWATTWDFQQCGMCDQQRLRPACAYAQSDQSLC